LFWESGNVVFASGDDFEKVLVVGVEKIEAGK
jgi:hypothetical protein